jgi:acetyltransferase-like isoleucine patch superfamily enzyme
VHYASTYPGFYSSQAGGAHFFGNSTDFAEHLPVKIEADVWIGTGAMILGGVSIGIGSVIAAGAIVSKPVPDYAIVGGVPAKIIRFRFDQDLRAELKSSRWWELGIEELNSLARFITAPQQFAAEAARLNA